MCSVYPRRLHERNMEQAAVFEFFDGGLDMTLVLNLAVNLASPNVNQDIVQLEDRSVEIKNENNYEGTVSRYSPDEFRSHFRMSRATMQELLTSVGNVITHDFHVPLEKKIMISVWLLANQESFLAVSDRFGTPKSTCHYVFKEVVMVLANMRHDYIRFPDIAEQKLISNVFEQHSGGIPGVVGAIDECHVPIKRPPNNAIDYYNRKGFHSIVLQAVCDPHVVFRDIYVGMPGRCHDARVFRNSPIHDRLTSLNQPLLRPDQHLIGDAAYPLSCYMLTPFRNTDHLTTDENRYNYKLSSIRSVIKRAFGLLEGRFQRLKYLDVSDMELAINVVVAACVLHNIITSNEGAADESDMLDDQPDGDGEEPHVEKVFDAANVKRNYIVSVL